MMRAVRAGFSYFGLVFAAGFAFGTARVLVLEPALGKTGAVLFELPFMLALSWLLAGWLVQRMAVPADTGARLVMGGTAFVLLQAAEFGLGMALGQAPGQYVAGIATTAGAIGLSAQLLFGLMPLFVRK